MQKKRIMIVILGFILLFNVTEMSFGVGTNPKNIALSQSSGFDDELVQLAIGGEKFSKSVMVKLTKNGEPDIVADPISLISKTQISCSFDLRNKPAGVWDLTITNPKKFLFIKKEKVTVIPEAFSIVATPTPIFRQIVPNRGLNKDSIKVCIQGENLNKNIVLQLIGGDQTVITGENAEVESDSSLTCFFNLDQKAPGDYDLQMKEANGRITGFKKAFRVDVYSGVSEINRDIQSLYFPLNQSSLSRTQLPRLEHDLTVLAANSNLYILIGGHTDERGSREYNLKLSARRAAFVKNYLVRHGIDPKRIKVYAYGENFPAQKGHAQIDWEQNRRVDILLLETPPSKEQGILHISD
ncbi:MAG TPA: hypothetical protein DDW50_01345 [Firmicutes bacterium]|jgi:outer membrane protein OmpA-like peptidoglycan-associated protein|nr:hypothetical protein [Bacillota bacterium]